MTAKMLIRFVNYDVVAIPRNNTRRPFDELRESLAANAHDSWSGWTRYMFSKCVPNRDGSIMIPAWAVERWSLQMNTAYADLPEDEKGSDRQEADKIIALQDAYLLGDMRRTVNRLLAENGVLSELIANQFSQIKVLRATVDQLREQAAAQPEPLDAPDAPGWWAFEGYFDFGDEEPDPNDIHRFPCEVRAKPGGLFAYTTSNGPYYVRVMHGKWCRLTLPWEGRGE